VPNKTIGILILHEKADMMVYIISITLFFLLFYIELVNIKLFLYITSIVTHIFQIS